LKQHAFQIGTFGTTVTTRPGRRFHSEDTLLIQFIFELRCHAATGVIVSD
jgi:hypothetical protein